MNENTNKADTTKTANKGSFQPKLLPEGSFAEMWWQGASKESKNLAANLTQMMAQLKPGVAIEIRKENGRLETRFILEGWGEEPDCLRGILMPNENN